MNRCILLSVLLFSAGGLLAQEIDLTEYTLPSQRFVTEGYVVECSLGLNCVWTGEAVQSRTYPTGASTYTMLKNYSGRPFEDYNVLPSAIRLSVEWGSAGNNTFFPGSGIKWLPRYLDLFGSASWADNILACINSTTCVYCDSATTQQVTGNTTAYFVLRLWNENLTPSGPEYILTRHNRWPPQSESEHELYYYGPNQGWLGWDHYSLSANGCGGGEYWRGDPYFPANDHLCLVKRAYVTRLIPDNGAIKSCN